MKSICSYFLFLFTVGGVCAQVASNDSLTDQRSLKKSAAIEMYYSLAVPSGDNFIGNGYETGTGIGFRIHMYPLRQIYAGAGMDFVGLDVNNQSLIGPYADTNRARYYVYAGYDFFLSGKFNVMADLAVGGVDFTNDPITPTADRFSESGFLLSPAASVEFEFADGFSAIARLTYSYIDMDFENLSPVIEDQFDGGAFFDISLGLKYTFQTRNKK